MRLFGSQPLGKPLPVTFTRRHDRPPKQRLIGKDTFYRFRHTRTIRSSSHLDGTPSLRILPPADFADARHEAVVRRVGDRTRFDVAMKQCRNKSSCPASDASDRPNLNDCSGIVK
jgi:hypothetical protein